VTAALPPAPRDHHALVALLDARMRAPFAWGTNDCVSFALDAAQAQTGVDLRPRLGCTWSTRRRATQALARRGGLRAAVDGVLRRVAPAKAHRGDIGLAEGPDGPFLVVIEGDLLVGVALDGLVRLPRAALRYAWSLDGQPYGFQLSGGPR
jgi:hypothetical protein